MWNPFRRRQASPSELREYLGTMTVKEAGRRGARTRRDAERERYRACHDELRATLGLEPIKWSDG